MFTHLGLGKIVAAPQAS